MHLEMTVVGQRLAAPPVDVVVECPPGTPLAVVLPDLARCAGGADGGADGGVDGVEVGGVRVGPGSLIGEPPLLRGAELVLVASTGERPRGPTGCAALRAGPVLRVVAGPGAGARAVLTLGRAVLGRSGSSLLPLADRTASRHHVDVDASPRGVRVRDAGSANGALLDGLPLPREWTPMAPGALLDLGRSQVQLAPPPERVRAAEPVPDGRGGLVVPPPPSATGEQPDRPPAVEVVELPAAPVLRRPAPVAWAAVLVPLLVAVPLAVLWSPLVLVLALSGPLVAVLGRTGDRVAGRRQHRLDVAAHLRATAAARERALRLVRQERADLDRAHPDPAAVRELVAARDPRVWGAGGGTPLAVRLGSARRPSGVVVRNPTGVGVAEGADEVLHHERGPLVVDLAGLPSLAVVAADEVALGALRCLLVQVAVLHGPEAVQVRVLTDRPSAWSWLRWLPHAGGGVLPPGSSVPEVPGRRSLVVDDASATPGATPMRSRPGRCVVTVLPAGSPAAGADAVLRLDEGGSGTWSGVAPGGGAAGVLPLVADLTDREWAGSVARELAPLRRPGPLGGAPVPSLRELLGSTGPDPADAAALAAGWATHRSGQAVGGRPRDAAVPLGVHEDGRPWLVDLERDGPHALVAGTTGSGKSSLLVCLVLALAVAVPPEELAVVVVDYKGGATAGRLRGLPHLVGAVTDLDGHLARRALVSLTAEVRRRERVLAEHGCSDRAELLGRHRDGARLLPRLLVVVDEVRVLTEEVPELVPGLVRLAAVGRSLGVHLVLATQRPAGVVSADARANTNLRIALRVRDVPDSLDVVEDPGAAHLPAAAPGAALVRRGGEALESVRVAAPRSRSAGPVRVAVLGEGLWGGPGGGPGGGPREGLGGVEDPSGEDEVPLVVAAAALAARGLPRLAAPWREPLPDALPWRCPAGVPVAAGVPLALLDEPESQAQPVLAWSASAPMAVLGGPGSGRTSLLRWVATAAAGGPAPVRDVHVVGDQEELGHLAALPRVGSVVDPADGEHLVRLLTALLAAAGEGRGAAAQPQPLLLVDRADRLLGAPLAAGAGGAAGRAEADHAADLLRRLLDEGAPVVVTGDPALLGSRALAAVREVLLLAPADGAAAVLAGVPAAAVPQRWPAGRALRLRGGPVRECQLPVLGGERGADADGGTAEQRRVVTEVAAGWTGAGTGADLAAVARGRLLRVPPLPRLLTGADLAAAEDDGGDDGALVVGVGGRAVTRRGLPLPPGSGALVVGPPGSGRSSALRSLAAAAELTGRGAVVLAPRTDGCGSAAAQQLMDRVAGPLAGGVVLVDDVELVLGTPLEGALLALLEGGAGCAVVAAGASGGLPAHRALVGALRRHRCGLLLHPLAPGDAELLGARPSPVRGGPPGRASLVVAGALEVVQLVRC